MYTLTDFRQLNFEKKCVVVTFYSSYLLQRKAEDCKVFLYYSGGYFIEVFYSPLQQRVVMINAFDNMASLEPYLDAISLEDLTAGLTI